MYDDLTPEMIEAINRDHLVTTPLRPADLLFIFGTRGGVPRFLEVIHQLWRQQFFNWALVSGGETGGKKPSEAAVISSAMIDLGIPREIILVEHQATNTGENVTFSLPIIDARIGLDNIRSIIAVGKYHTSSRYLMTLQRHWPHVEKMFAPVQLYSDVEEWHNHATLRAKVIDEWRKIPRYLEFGFIDPWPPAGS